MSHMPDRPKVERVLIGADIAIGGGAPLAVIAGPCVVESLEHALRQWAVRVHLPQRLGTGPAARRQTKGCATRPIRRPSRRSSS